LARRAIVLHEGSLTEREVRLGRILDFFGVPWRPVAVSDLGSLNWGSEECAALGPVHAVAAALEKGGGAIPPSTAFYAYLTGDRRGSESKLQALCGRGDFTLQQAPARELQVAVSGDLGGLTGPMSGLEFRMQLGEEDALLAGAATESASGIETIVSAGGSPVFLRISNHGADVFLCASSRIVDIDQPVGPRFYDVKDHFCSVVPLVMFVRSAFPDVAWHPQELGACLIIDDPLLKQRYGFCDFPKLQTLMQGHGFNTNISFIPWNWRRTSASAAEFFKRESDLFSVSIHGCDHIAGEFGAVSAEELDERARLAQSRMRSHEARTGIHHDSVMVFPQGVFSSGCPEALKRNGFLAAVNTETVPVDSQNARTRIRDVWDVAITSYGGFPVFTRRYAFHGVENFAFDLLLGKPCLIVSHHDAFKDGGNDLIALIDRLHALNCSLRWQSLGKVVRRACRRRRNGSEADEIEMYGTEVWIENPLDRAIEVKVRKREARAELVEQVLCGDHPLTWTTQADQLVFVGEVPPRSEEHFRVVYRDQTASTALPRSFRYEISVALRRILSEVRDDYLSRSRLMSITLAKLKGAVAGRG